jgi:F-type H+-transporting ATPase subunit a
MIKPLSLALRLFGNVFGAFILMEFIYIVVPLALPGILGLWFDIADGILQAVIFTYLTVTYVGEIIEGSHIAMESRKEKEKKRLTA